MTVGASARREAVLASLPVFAVFLATACGRASGEPAPPSPSDASSWAPAVAQGASDAAPNSPPQVVHIQPLGAQLPDEAVDLTKTALREFYGFDVRMLERRDLPQSAYYAPRKRYRAERLLDYVTGIAPAGAFRVIGLTGVDISTTKGRVYDWGIMGLATLDGSACVMSMYRCRRGSTGPLHARERLGKVAVHEVGHTLGLEHCPTRGCLMEDARGTNTTTDREHLLCPRCRALLEARGYVLPPNPTPPWRPPRAR